MVRRRCGSIDLVPDEPDVPAHVGLPGSPSSGASKRAPAIVIGGVVVALLAGAGAVVALRAGGASAGAGAPRFVEEARAAGIDHAYDGEFEYFVGGGVAAFDCDDDGRSELYLAGGSEPAALYRNQSPIGGALRFERQVSPATDLTAVTGAYPLDIDSDRTMDLVVLRRGGNIVLRGLGDCRFEPANEQLGLDGGEAWTAAFSATWEGTSALPTLAFGNYLAPDGTTCDDSQLLRPTAGGDAYAPPVPLAPGYCTLSVLFSDWSRSGRRDLRVTNDRHYYLDGEDQMWRIDADQPPRSYSEAEGWRPLHIWGMGIASRDLTGDGYPEVFITSQGDNKLQTLTAGPEHPTYEDIALSRGVTAQRPAVGGDVLPSTAWHPEFEDVNNDGFVDLFVTKGNVEAQVDYASRDPSDLFLGRADGTFAQATEDAGIVSFDRARGAAVVDLNLDGMLDLVVVNRRQPVKVWRNVGRGDAERPAPTGRWLAVRLQQPGPNVDAVGAWLEVRADDRTTSREVTVGGGHASGEAGWLHTGLGDAEAAQVRVQWPDGETGPWMTVAADSFVTIERGAAEAVPWLPEG
jgi:enediyne biosynthesis protein E4